MTGKSPRGDSVPPSVKLKATKSRSDAAKVETPAVIIDQVIFQALVNEGAHTKVRLFPVRQAVLSFIFFIFVDRF